MRTRATAEGTVVLTEQEEAAFDREIAQRPEPVKERNVTDRLLEKLVEKGALTKEEVEVIDPSKKETGAIGARIG